MWFDRYETRKYYRISLKIWIWNIKAFLIIFKIKFITTTTKLIFKLFEITRQLTRIFDIIWLYNRLFKNYYVE